MTSLLKSAPASSRPDRPTQTSRTPRMTSPAKPRKLIISIGGSPTRKTGSSGSNRMDSDWRDRIGSSMVAVPDGRCERNMLQPIAGNDGGIGRIRLRKLHGCHAGADFRAQFVDQL